MNSSSFPSFLLLVVFFLGSPSAKAFLNTPTNATSISFSGVDGHRNRSYQVSVDRLFSYLISSISSSTKFSTATRGVGPDRVHGLVLCNDNLPLGRCLACLREASAFLSPACPNPRYDPDPRIPRKTTCPLAIFAWFDNCYAYYAAVDYAGNIRNKTSLGCYDGLSTPQKPDAARLRRRLRLARRLIGEALKARSMFSASGSSLAQCVRDVTAEECRRCFGEAMEFAMGSLETCGRVSAHSGNCRFIY